jgi:hypothetical protein
MGMRLRVLTKFPSLSFIFPPLRQTHQVDALSGELVTVKREAARLRSHVSDGGGHSGTTSRAPTSPGAIVGMATPPPPPYDAARGPVVSGERYSEQHSRPGGAQAGAVPAPPPRRMSTLAPSGRRVFDQAPPPV